MKKYGIRIKPPKTERGYRTIDLDDGTIAILLRRKAEHQRIAAGIPDDAEVDLSLIRLPAKALMFPALSVSFTAPRHPRNVSREFADRAETLGFGHIRFHDLRGIHSTALDAGVPVHRVAQRLGDDPAVVLRHYTKRKRRWRLTKSCPGQSRVWRPASSASNDFAPRRAVLAKALAKFLGSGASY